MNTNKLKIAIIGGSIAGCAAAILLSRLGHKVTVFERSASNLADRGAGIVLPQDLQQTLIDQDLCDADSTGIKLNSRTFHIKSANNQSKEIWQQPLLFITRNWGNIFKQLRKRIDSTLYNSGKILCKITQNTNSTVTLDFTDGSQANADLVLCCDGLHSLGRKVLFPESHIEYAGYITWRGILPATKSPTQEHFYSQLNFYGYQAGHALCYPIMQHDNKTNDYCINWLVYEKITNDNRDFYFTDRNGDQQKSSIPANLLSDSQLEHLHHLAKQYFPADMANIIEQTNEPFIQTIYDMSLPSYYQNRICLLGDASTLIRPHVGSGATKALTDTLTLCQQLAETDDVDLALKQWNETACPAGNNLVELGRILGRALVTDVPNWQDMNQHSMDNWWSNVMAENSWYLVDDANQD